jgi:hypothetical protein
MLKIISSAILSLSVLTLSSAASASLITNGGFEQLTFKDNSKSYGAVKKTSLTSYQYKGSAWDIFYTLPGWITTAGNGIELQKNVVTKSQQGTNHIELDSHLKGRKNTVMTQSVNSLTVGTDYLLEFYYKPRTNTKNDNGINVFWYEQETKFNFGMDTNLVADSTKGLTPDWILKSVKLTAKSESMNLSFGAFGKQNSLGGLIDNVSLVEINNIPATEVPEPSLFALSLLSFGLLVRRHHKKVSIKAS